ncbi:hypothetical protein FP435_03825 [Lactobacillus sp. PV037]|uniref:hypothetical protein n=1 Tax=unclassified Lactobacillus TaxID=2620435 RepID=UPI00223EDF90|nr:MULTISPECIES: hypothetical protein [unclassified Lactobacillus]QNQ82258.1 hypothetical protein FP433_04005 [Lactobacillus sp. PV012]QNQ83631.1 hypothetical protein FP435_03825 [Lactobacillus sp. PV037]
MTELSTKLFLDVKKFEKYQAMLKKQVHLSKETLVDSPKFPDEHIYNRTIRVLAKQGGALTNKELVLNFDFRTSEVKDATSALLTYNLVTKENINDKEYKLSLTDAGFNEAQKLEDRRNEISEAAYGSITPEEQEQLDKLIVKLLKNYEARDVNYTALENMMFK